MKTRIMKLCQLFTLIFGFAFGTPFVSEVVGDESAQIKAACLFGNTWFVWQYEADAWNCYNGGTDCCPEP